MDNNPTFVKYQALQMVLRAQSSRVLVVSRLHLRRGKKLQRDDLVIMVSCKRVTVRKSQVCGP